MNDIFFAIKFKEQQWRDFRKYLFAFFCLNPFVLLFVVWIRKTKGFKQKDSNNKTTQINEEISGKPLLLLFYAVKQKKRHHWWFYKFFRMIQNKNIVYILFQKGCPFPAFFCLFLPFFFLKKKKRWKRMKRRVQKKTEGFPNKNGIWREGYDTTKKGWQKKRTFFCKAWTGRIFLVSLPVGPDNRFKVFQSKTCVPSCPFCP